MQNWAKHLDPRPGILHSFSYVGKILPPSLVKTGGRFSPKDPLAPQLRVRPEVGLVGKEYPGFSPLGLLPQGSVLCHEGLPFGLISLDQTFPNSNETSELNVTISDDYKRFHEDQTQA